MVAALSRWWFAPAPRARVAVLRVVLYAFIPVDLFVTTSWVRDHADVPSALYQPLSVGRLLHLPTPTRGFVLGLMVTLLAATAVALSGRLPRLAGAAVAVLYAEWMVIAYSYGKVDHDRFTFLVALAVLPTVGRARLDDDRSDDAAGFALRCVQVAAVLTYLLAVWGKFRFGGLAWLDSATLLRAVLRRPTAIGELLGEHPWTLHVAQYVVVALELASPLLFARGRVGRVALAVAVVFHLLTFATVRIIFLPHLLCLLAFLPLERVAAGLRQPSPAEGGPDLAMRRARYAEK